MRRAAIRDPRRRHEGPRQPALTWAIDRPTVERVLGRASKADPERGAPVRGLTFEWHRHFAAPGPTIRGVPFSGSDVDEAFISMRVAGNGRALVIGELPVLAGELAWVEGILVEAGATISAVHNHWVQMKPRILYVHFQATGDPIELARALRPIRVVLR